MRVNSPNITREELSLLIENNYDHGRVINIFLHLPKSFEVDRGYYFPKDSFSKLTQHQINTLYNKIIKVL